MMSDRQVAFTKLDGFFPLPMGIKFLQYEVGNWPSHVDVSTVCLDGAHLEDPLNICEPEHGYETMVFLAGCSFFSVHTRHYETKTEAKNGHKAVVDGLVAGIIPLSAPIANYRAAIARATTPAGH